MKTNLRLQVVLLLGQVGSGFENIFDLDHIIYSGLIFS